METKEYIAWKSVYNTGIPVIDEQHKKWIGILNDLYESIKSGTSNVFVENILQELFDYTNYHFLEEEVIYRKYPCELTASHLAEHKKFINTLKLLQIDYKKNNLLLSFKMMDSLKDWLINHILGTDKEYVNYLKSVNYSLD